MYVSASLGNTFKSLNVLFTMHYTHYSQTQFQVLWQDLQTTGNYGRVGTEGSNYGYNFPIPYC